MGNVVQLVHCLDCRPELPAVEGIELRHFAGPADIDVWLEIRRRAFARQQVGVRDWARADFAAEFLSKPWWRDEALWFARRLGSADSGSPGVVRGVGTDVGTDVGTNVGTVTLGWRGPALSGKPVIHWLAVLPRERHRGIGRLLVRQVERLVWDAGGRAVHLETHAAWSEAAALYQSLGYGPA